MGQQSLVKAIVMNVFSWYIHEIFIWWVPHCYSSFLCVGLMVMTRVVLCVGLMVMTRVVS